MIEQVTCQFCASRCGMLLDLEYDKPVKLLKAPCENACPAGIDIPRYIRFIADRQYAEAVKVIREKAPLPGVLGSVCHHPCEPFCRRGESDESLSIKALKGFAAEHGTGSGSEDKKNAAPTGKRVAVVGSGPSGLTAGYYLAKVGHEVTILEASPAAGGMMREGIPPYRLPREILDREIEDIKAVGVQIRTGHRVEAVDDLFSQGYDAVFIGIGARKAVGLDIEGETDSRVMDSLSFLRRVNSGERVETGDVVAVVGGGYAAMDSARSARRLGATDVTILYRRTRHEMKASATEIDEAMAEGVKIRMLAAPHKITLSNGKLNLECIEQKLGAMDESGRRLPEPVECTEFSLQFDTVITAIGQYPEIPPALGLVLGEGNTIQVDPSNLTSSRTGVFAGGDAVTGPASVIDAIAAGRRAAISIDRYLGGRGEINHIVPSSNAWIETEGVGPVSGYKNRLPIDMSPLDKRTKSFSRVEIGFDEARAIEEADRCLWCDLVDGDEAHPLSRGWTCKRGRADTARRYMRAHKI